MFKSYLINLMEISQHNVHPRTDVLWAATIKSIEAIDYWQKEAEEHGHKWDTEYFIWPDNTVIPIDDFMEEEWPNKSDDYYRVNIPSYIKQESKAFWAYVHASWNQKKPNNITIIVDNKETNMPGFTVESYIKRWVEQWFNGRDKGPSFKEVVTSLDGVVNGWHKVIGSTAPAYLTAPGFACTLYQAATKHEGNSRVWQAVRLF